MRAWEDDTTEVDVFSESAQANNYCITYRARKSILNISVAAA